MGRTFEKTWACPEMVEFGESIARLFLPEDEVSAIKRVRLPLEHHITKEDVFNIWQHLFMTGNYLDTLSTTVNFVISHSNTP